MTSQILANRHTQELENMERMFTRITRDFERELLTSDEQAYRPLLMTLNDAEAPDNPPTGTAD
ncbi:hypothetical protein [Aliamphritea spongicola]|uniref:hypothetical protein n=1 Tax=Aliamphritea spongicola TaxID=707589 RepID=UPI00196A945A|nr:hypothetical protein [Aliamphritea spongicola]MBN3563447.1 hypothetical protein [Aliamphritea spongicola]